ncbi:hypothetical protein L208DRAFT_1250053, partial [Tricholoma matsutake]
ATSNRNQSRTDPDIGGPQLDPLGPVLIGPWTEKRLVWTGLFLHTHTSDVIDVAIHVWLYGILALLNPIRPDSSVGQSIWYICSDTTKILIQKCFWSYLNQFLTIFDDPGTESEVNMCGSKVQHMLGRKTNHNRFYLVSVFFLVLQTGHLNTISKAWQIPNLV